MDKEIVRIIIIATGLLIIMGILLWSYLKDKKARQIFDIFDEQIPIRQRKKNTPPIKENDIEIIKKSPVIESVEIEQEEPYFVKKEEYDVEDDDYNEPQARAIAPEIVKLILIARSELGFNGEDLFSALESAGLTYGKLKIFERLDANRMVDFGVACLTPHGIFPDTDLKNFYCSGIVFFMQPSLLDNPVMIFDEIIDVIDILATDLDAKVYDGDKQLLTLESMKAIRCSL